MAIMTADLKELIKARLPISHFLCVSFLGLVLVSLSYVFFIPLIYWSMYGVDIPEHADPLYTGLN